MLAYPIEKTLAKFSVTNPLYTQAVLIGVFVLKGQNIWT